MIWADLRAGGDGVIGMGMEVDVGGWLTTSVDGVENAIVKVASAGSRDMSSGVGGEVSVRSRRKMRS